MRSSKSRSRSKANRPRTLGNIINRVFDSSGPEGKVRGTPQQIIEKYLFLGRDAQLSNDRVAAENFLQHAEHYTRLLAEAQRELQAEQEARQQAHGGQNGGGQRGDRQGRDDRDQRADRGDWRGEQPRADFRDDRGADMTSGIEIVETEDDTGLVETPEMRQEPAPAPEAPGADAAPGKPDRGNRRPRGPRRPKGDPATGGEDGGGEGGGGAGGDGPSAEAAE